MKTNQIRVSGLIAMFGGMLGVVLTFPFAAAYFQAYPGFDTPPLWLTLLRPMLAELLTFALPVPLYNLYGRLFALVYLLILPGVYGLHAIHRACGNRIELWGFRMLVTALVVTFVGVIGDYWANGAGFTMELVGLLSLLLGTTLFGKGILATHIVPSESAFMLMLAGPGSLLSTWLIGHIPSGPSFLFLCIWVRIGYMLWQYDPPLSEASTRGHSPVS